MSLYIASDKIISTQKSFVTWSLNFYPEVFFNVCNVKSKIKNQTFKTEQSLFQQPSREDGNVPHCGREMVSS